jgi:protein-disulfide isomerase
MSDRKKPISKRKEIKEGRRKRQQRQRVITLSIIGVVVVVIAGLIAAPSIRAAVTPVGAIVQITPVTYPNAQGTSMGSQNAKVKVDVFEDFQCPNCRNFTTDVQPQIVTTYVDTGKIYYTVHMFPFLDSNSATKESQQAANAAECAADQGRFWDYEQMLYANWQGENVGSFTDKRLVAFAQGLSLNMTTFNSCFSGNKNKSKVDADLALGTQMGVNGTPSVFVNQVEVAPGVVPDFTQMQTAIDAALAGK